VSARILELRYAAPSQVLATPAASSLELALEGARTVGVSGRVKQVELFRDALLLAAAIRDSDLRYKGKDRTAYLAYLMKQGKKASKAIWEAQKSFLENAFGDEAPRPRGLDPILSVDPDEVSLEVFSKDESAYARLAFDNALFEQRTAAHGTTLADLSPALLEQVERLRSYQPLDFSASTEAKGATTSAHQRSVELPDPWLRGFLQVQSAATLPATTLELKPVDLYNVLFTLRTRKAKKPPRGLRFELVPGERPRLTLEPWEITVETHGAPYAGPSPRIVRLYGRQRLLALTRALPHLRSVKIHLLGAGLPSFWVLDMGLARMTVAFTSWAESQWGSTASFDALIPNEGKQADVDAVAKLLAAEGPRSLAQLAASTKHTELELRALLQQACLRGQVLFDRDRAVFRPRALLPQPVELAAIRFGSPREAAAHRLLAADKAITITKLHNLSGEGNEISGEVVDAQARRSFAPRFTSNLEGQVKEAFCNCPSYQRSALREGPCEHMIALFVFFKRKAAETERLRLTPEGRKLIRAETRTFLQRDSAGYQRRCRLTLDDRTVRSEVHETAAGEALAEPRFQRLWFDSDSAARDAYFERLDQLAKEGFIDIDAESA
jgi:predicted nucleic acid-binding Zn finger protein